jgi:hypothetical protein
LVNNLIKIKILHRQHLKSANTLISPQFKCSVVAGRYNILFVPTAIYTHNFVIVSGQTLQWHPAFVRPHLEIVTRFTFTFSEKKTMTTSRAARKETK